MQRVGGVDSIGIELGVVGLIDQEVARLTKLVGFEPHEVVAFLPEVGDFVGIGRVHDVELARLETGGARGNIDDDDKLDAV